MIVWRDQQDRDVFHFGVMYRGLEKAWYFSMHIDALVAFGEPMASLIAEEAFLDWADLDELRSRVLAELANKVRDHCAAIARQHGANEVANEIMEYKHELGTEDS